MVAAAWSRRGSRAAAQRDDATPVIREILSIIFVPEA